MSIAEERKAARTVRMAILRAGAAAVRVDGDHADNLKAALAQLPSHLVRNRPEGDEVIIADLNVFLGRVYNDRCGSGGRYYEPNGRSVLS